MRCNDGVLGDSRLLGQPATALENRALHQLSGHYPIPICMKAPSQPGFATTGATSTLLCSPTFELSEIVQAIIAPWSKSRPSTFPKASTTSSLHKI